MKKQLTFVRGAVADKDLVPVLTHFHIQDGHIQGGNGRLAIDIACAQLAEFNITVPADKFIKAVDGCEDEPELTLTEGGQLRVKHGSFRVLLPLGEHDAFPRVELAGEELTGTWTGFIKALRILKPFIGTDASRVWSCGILMQDGVGYATNNVILVRVPLGFGSLGFGSLNEPVNIPAFAVDELLRIGQDPVRVLRSDNAVTFVFPGGGWLRTQLLDLGWPDLSNFFIGTDVDLPKNLANAVQKIVPFCPNSKLPVIRFADGGVCTEDGTMSARVDGLELPDALFRAEPLMDVLKVATHADFSKAPSPFIGDGVQGVIIGLRR